MNFQPDCPGPGAVWLFWRGDKPSQSAPAGRSQLPRKRPRPLRLLTTFASTTPKGRGLGKEMKFAWTAKGSPFGRAVKADRH